MRPALTKFDRFIVRLEIVHALGLGVWGGAIGITSIVAALAFPTMRDLDPRLLGHPGAADDHWLIVAGHLAAPLFAILGWVQLACLVTVGGALLLMALGKGALRASAWGRTRLIVLGLLAAMAGYYSGSLEPRMSSELHAYWSAAREGRVGDANRHREQFNDDHPLASRVLGATLLLVGAGLALAIVHPASPRSKQHAGESEPS